MRKVLLLLACAVPSLALAGSGPTALRPKSNPGYWITKGDYPSQSLRNLEEGTVGFRLGVDTQGSVKSCEVTLSSGHPLLDQQTCDLLARRAQFVPGRDEHGQPAGGGFRSSVVWILPYPADFEEGVSYLGVAADLDLKSQLLVINGTVSGPARHAGIVKGDMLVSIDGQRVRKFKEIAPIMAKLREGDRFKLSLIRDGEPLTLDAVVQTLPPLASEEGKKLKAEAWPLFFPHPPPKLPGTLFPPNVSQKRRPPGSG